MEDPTKDTFPPEVHIEMWKHYDNLRQAKNGTFLTANSILVAIGGLVVYSGFRTRFSNLITRHCDWGLVVSSSNQKRRIHQLSS